MRQPPDNVKGGPQATEPGNRRHHIAAAAKQGEAAPSVTRRHVKGRRQRSAKRREATTCRVSLLLPSAHRALYHYLARCPVCAAPHMGRARELADVTVTRQLPCGHWVAIVIARTYGREAA